MKQFKKPEFKINKINDYSEPVFMACSGSNFFEVDAKAYKHQSYEGQRTDCRFRVFAEYSGPAYQGDLYIIATYDDYVNAKSCDGTSPFGWHFTEIISDDQKSKTLVAVARNISLNSNPEGIGFGDMVVQLEGEATGVSLLNVKLAFDPNGCY